MNSVIKVYFLLSVTACSAQQVTELSVELQRMMKKVYNTCTVNRIQIFHQLHGISYNTPYDRDFGVNKLEKAYPLQFALERDHTDFAVYLLDQQKVAVDVQSFTGKDALYYLVEGCMKYGARDDHRILLKKLVDRGAPLNSIYPGDGVTPLARYSRYTVSVLPPVLAFIKDFFHHGARIVTTKSYREVTMRCDVLQGVVNSIPGRQFFMGDHDIVNDLTTLIATMLRARLECVKKPYIKYMWAFKQLNAKKVQIDKIPRPVVNLIVDKAVEAEDVVFDALHDIHDSLAGNGWCKKTILAQLQASKQVGECKALYQIVALTFWGQPLSVCIRYLDSVLDKK
jgi:hypothetical protein